MPTKDISVKIAQSDAAVDQLDTGTTDPNGDIVYRDSADVAIAPGAVSDPAFGAADGTATATANAIGTADCNYPFAIGCCNDCSLYIDFCPFWYP